LNKSCQFYIIEPVKKEIFFYFTKPKKKKELKTPKGSEKLSLAKIFYSTKNATTNPIRRAEKLSNSDSINLRNI